MDSGIESRQCTDALCLLIVSGMIKQIPRLLTIPEQLSCHASYAVTFSRLTFSYSRYFIT